MKLSAWLLRKEAEGGKDEGRGHSMGSTGSKRSSGSTRFNDLNDLNFGSRSGVLRVPRGWSLPEKL